MTGNPEPATALTVRRPSFGIDESVPFQWQPANPEFGLFGNVFTFLAIAFERYIVAVTRQAMARIDDETVAAEADAFLRQEAQHARAHRAHAQAMIAHHPDLAGTMDDVTAAYDRLLEREGLAFHLAYVADLEATFTPLFKMVLDHRLALFERGDERVGTLLLWHFVEEIEHRSSALVIHRHVTPDPRFRVRAAPKVFWHVTTTYRRVVTDIARIAGPAACGVDPGRLTPLGMWAGELLARSRLVPARRRRPSMLAHVPGPELRAMLGRLAASQSAGHDPATEALPAWAAEWHAAYDAGDDIATYAGARLRSAPGR